MLVGELQKSWLALCIIATFLAVSSFLIVSCFVLVLLQDVNDSLLHGPLRAALPGDVRVHRLWYKQHHSTQYATPTSLMDG